jgi:membrane protein
MTSILGDVTLKELALKTWRAVYQHDCLGKAAELAFYFLLALFPLLIVLLNLISFMPGVQEIILFWLSRLMPRDATHIVEIWVQNVFANRSGGLVSFGLIFSLWAASTGVGALISALNSAYEVEEGRPFWKAQLVALGVIVALCLLVIGGAVLITFGDPLVSGLANLVGYQRTIGTIWLVIRYLMGLVMLLVGMAVIYLFAPNVRQRWTCILPGTLFAVVTFVIASYLFSLYIRYAPSYNAIYGSLGAVIVLMLWFYLMGLIMYVGGEINSQIGSAAGKGPVRRRSLAPRK